MVRYLLLLLLFVPDSYGLPGRTTTEQTYTIFDLR